MLYLFFNRCNPNPCEHGGICKQNWEEFKCDCDKTGYHGAVCHIRKFFFMSFILIFNIKHLFL